MQKNGMLMVQKLMGRGMKLAQQSIKNTVLYLHHAGQKEHAGDTNAEGAGMKPPGMGGGMPPGMGGMGGAPPGMGGGGPPGMGGGPGGGMPDPTGGHQQALSPEQMNMMEQMQSAQGNHAPDGTAVANTHSRGSDKEDDGELSTTAKLGGSGDIFRLFGGDPKRPFKSMIFSFDTKDIGDDGGQLEGVQFTNFACKKFGEVSDPEVGAAR